MIIGYIDNLSDISDQILNKHLMEVKDFSNTTNAWKISYISKRSFFQGLGSILRYDQ